MSAPDHALKNATSSNLKTDIHNNFCFLSVSAHLHQRQQTLSEPTQWPSSFSLSLKKFLISLDTSWLLIQVGLTGVSV